jgi:putative tryptophan/tyrosine transport system substrate-binding protein
MRRRAFIEGIAASAAAWPLESHAQQRERMRRIGVLDPTTADDPLSQTGLAAFLQELGRLGWIVDRNVTIDYRWAAGDTERMRSYATELIALTPDVLLVTSGTALPSVLQATRTLPVVFLRTVDPVGAGFVVSLSHPGET